MINDARFSLTTASAGCVARGVLMHTPRPRGRTRAQVRDYARRSRSYPRPFALGADPRTAHKQGNTRYYPVVSASLKQQFLTVPPSRKGWRAWFGNPH